MRTDALPVLSRITAYTVVTMSLFLPLVLLSIRVFCYN